jgi:hypothetical protein
VLEPTQWLTHWFLRFSSPLTRAMVTHYKHPPLMNIVDPQRSPITKLLQVFSGMLRGDSPRLQLLWRSAHCGSFDEWAAKATNQEALIRFRHGVTIAASWTHRRFRDRYPWVLASLADDRLPMVRRRAIAADFMAAAPEELDEMFGIRFRATLTSADDLFQPHVQKAIFAWAWNVRLSTAPVEFAHGRNRRRASSSGSWSSFVEQYVNAESVLNHRVKTEILRQATGQAPTPHAPIPATRTAARRKLTAMDLYRFEFYDTTRALGRPVNVVALWPEIRAGWESLAPEVRATYEVQATEGVYRPRGMPVLADQPAAAEGQLVAIPPEVTEAVGIAQDAELPAGPLLPNELGQALTQISSLASGGMSVRRAAEIFAHDHIYVGKGARDFQDAPYPRVPRGPPARPDLGAIQAQTQAILGRFVDGLGTKATRRHVFKHNTLISCEVMYETALGHEPMGHAVLLHIASASATAGRAVARANFLVCEPTLALPTTYEGATVRYAKEALIEVDPLPFARLAPAHGSLVHKCDDDIARYLLSTVGEGDEVLRVRCKRVEADVSGGDRWVLKGLDPSFDESTDDAAGAPAAQDEDDNDIDWFDFGQSHAMPAAGAPSTSAARAPRPRASGRQTPTFVEGVDWVPEEVEGLIGLSDNAAVFEEMRAMMDLQVESSDSDIGHATDRPAPLAKSKKQPRVPGVSAGAASSGSGMTAAQRLQGKRERCLEDMGDVVSGQAVCDALEYTLSHQWKIIQQGEPMSTWDLLGTAIGDIRVTFDGRTLQGQCRHPDHKPRCKLLLTMGSDMKATEAKLVKWVIAGCTKTIAEHAAIGLELRASHASR